MARIRTIKPSFWDDLKLGRLSRDTRLLYIGMWNFADDMGVLIGDLYWLKSKVFPYDQIQMQQFEKWVSDLVKTGFIYLFSHKGEEFIYLPTFTRHQKIDKPNHKDLNVPKGLVEKLQQTIVEQSNNNRGTISDYSAPIEEEEEDKDIYTLSNEREEETSSSALASTGSKDEVVDIKRIVEMYHTICVDYPKLVKLSASRKNKIKLRFKEMDCNYTTLETVFTKMQQSNFMKGEKGWTADFDWLMENDKNWLKILEGKYDNAGVPKGGEKKSELQKSVEFQQKMGVTNESIIF